MRKCYLCQAKKFERVKGVVRDMPDMLVLKCKKCGLIFLENFDHITNGFYEESKMRKNSPVEDWKLYLRECAVDDSRRAKWVKAEFAGRTVLDFGCGGGGFLVKIKDFVKKCAGFEKDKRLKRLIEGRFGINIYSDIRDVDFKFDIITLFHTLEHFKDPRDMLSKLSRLLNKGGKIIIEVPNANDALLSLYDCKPFSNFTYWGCHLYLFSNSTLRKLIQQSGLGIKYIKQIQRYSLSNHLYWLSKGKPGGHKIWRFLNNAKLNNEYERQLANLDICDTIIASVCNKE